MVNALGDDVFGTASAALTQSQPAGFVRVPDRFESAHWITRTALCVEVRDPRRASGPKAEAEGTTSGVMYAAGSPTSYSNCSLTVSTSRISPASPAAPSIASGGSSTAMATGRPTAGSIQPP